MKKIIFILTFVLFAGIQTFAQNFAYVDTEFILQKMPAYQQSQNEINRMVEGWKAEIEQRYKEIDNDYRRFQAEQVLLSEKERMKREEMIVGKEKATREFQKQKFGPEGELFQRKQQLIAPIQEQVYAAIETLSQKKRLDFVFDKSSSANILFANPKLDLTSDVLRELGISSK